MTLDEAIVAIKAAGDRHEAMMVANSVAMESMAGKRPYEEELAVRQAWWESWGYEHPKLGDAGPRRGSNWTGD